MTKRQSKIDLPAAPTAQVGKLTRLRAARGQVAELCPEGVEFKELGEVVKLEKGKQLNKELLSEVGEYPAYNGGISYSGFTNTYNYDEHTIIISQGGASAGFVNFITTKFYANAHCYVVLPNQKLVENRFVFHFLKLNQEKLTEKQHGAGIPALKTTEILKLKIPLPPFAIQQEIVKILDTFTTMEAELEAELEARKKQYEYYREELLMPVMVNDKWLMNGEEIEWKTLGEVGVSINAGGDLPDNYRKGQKVPSDEFPYPIYSNGTEEKALYGFTDCYKVDSEAVTISARGTIGYHTVRKAKFTPIVRLITLIANTEIITSNFLNYILDITEIGHSGGSIPQLTVPNVKKIKIPIPPLAEQERIVAILDKFDALVNDLPAPSALSADKQDDGWRQAGISVGLPAELNARRKQYEYYRGKLLTFKEKI